MSTETRIIHKETFDIIHSAVTKMVNVIRDTYGPAGNKVIISKTTHSMVVDDGVQAARDFELEDPAEQAVVRLVREAAVRTNDRMGDGTTGAMLMVQGIIDEVATRSNRSGRQIVAELEKGLSDFKEQILKSAKQIKTKEELRKVAKVSFDNEHIANMIADLYFKLGKDGVITIDKSPTMDTTAEISEGITIKNGFLSPYMVTNPDRMETVIEKPYILITDYRLTEANDVLPILNKMAEKGLQGLVIIAENVEQHALATLVINLPHVMNPHTRKPGVLLSVAINAPSGENRKQSLEDMALLTGARMFTESKGDKLETATVEDLGRAERIIVRQDESIIVGPKGKRSEVKQATEDLRKAVEAELNDTKKKALVKRLGMFTNTVAVIKVGARTENEQKALKYKVEDAVNAVKAAYKGGVVCGAGMSLARVKTSSSILNAALKLPARQLRKNMGLDADVDYAKDEVVNVVTGETGKFMDVGVTDPVEVLVAGVESAVSIASILVTSSSMIVESIRKPKVEN